MSREVSRRDAVKALGGLGAAGMLGLGPEALEAAGESAERPEPGPRPNFLFIMTDDHAVQALSAYGGRLIETPALDRLAAQGMRFDNCFVTNSLCAPSRATILTGKYSHLHGVTENIFREKKPFDGSQQTYPKLLREAGYKTAMVGKWHLKSEPTGFDYWNVLPGQGRYRNPKFIEMGEEREYPGYVTDVITDLTIEALDERLAGDQPFLLISQHKAPHRRWVPDEEDEDLYTGQDLPVPATFNDDWMNRASPAEHADMRVADMPDWKKEQPPGMSEQERKHWNYQRYIKEYQRTLVSLDRNVGRLMEHLERTGLAENTIVVYTSDNGFFLGDHGWYDKRFMYEESLRVPLLVRYPRAVAPGSVEARPVLNLDFAETFLDYAGVPIPDDMQGRSMRPLMEGRPAPDWRRSVYYHYYEYPGPHRVRPHYGVRGERFKLIHYYTVGEWELFDLEQDPHELNSVYEAPRYAEVVLEMKEELKRLRKHYRDDTGEPVE